MIVLLGSGLIVLTVAAAQPVWYALAADSSCALTPEIFWWSPGALPPRQELSQRGLRPSLLRKRKKTGGICRRLVALPF